MCASGGMVRTAQPGIWFRSSEYVFVHRIEPLVMYLFGSSLHKAGEAVLGVLLNSKGPGGRYWHQEREEEISPQILRIQDCEWLWETSCQIVNISTDRLYRDSGTNAARHIEMYCASKLAVLVRMKYDAFGVWSDVHIHASYDDMGSTMMIYDGTKRIDVVYFDVLGLPLMCLTVNRVLPQHKTYAFEF